MRKMLVRAILVFAWESLLKMGIEPIAITVTCLDEDYMLLQEEVHADEG